MKQITEVTELIQHKLRPGFYGHVELSIVDGKISTVKISETLKPGDLSSPARMIENAKRA